MLLNGLISLVIFLFVVSGAIFFIAKQQFEAPGPLVQTRSVIVPRGEALSEISRRLEREGIINDATLFLAGVFLSKSGDKLKAGEYLFPEHASMRDVMDLLVEGKAILHKFTVPEGLTSEQIVERLKEDEILVGEVGEIPPEGALLPDTYKFTRGTERMAMIERMRSARDRARSTAAKASATAVGSASACSSNSRIKSAYSSPLSSKKAVRISSTGNSARVRSNNATAR